MYHTILLEYLYYLHHLLKISIYTIAIIRSNRRSSRISCASPFSSTLNLGFSISTFSEFSNAKSLTCFLLSLSIYFLLYTTKNFLAIHFIPLFRFDLSYASVSDLPRKYTVVILHTIDLQRQANRMHTDAMRALLYMYDFFVVVPKARDHEIDLTLAGAGYRRQKIGFVEQGLHDQIAEECILLRSGSCAGHLSDPCNKTRIAVYSKPHRSLGASDQECILRSGP